MGRETRFDSIPDRQNGAHAHVPVSVQQSTEETHVFRKKLVLKVMGH